MLRWERLKTALHPLSGSYPETLMGVERVERGDLYRLLNLHPTVSAPGFGQELNEKVLSQRAILTK